MPLTLGLLGSGVVLLFGRSRLILDRKERVVVSWWGMLGVGRMTKTSLEGCRMVSVGCETRGKGKQRRVVHPVKIQIEGKKKGYEVCAPEDPDEGRARGEEVAKFLGLGLDERNTGTRALREAGTLDESLRERLLRRGPQPRPSEPPDGARSRLVSQGSTLRVEIPASGFLLMHKAQVGFGAGLVVERRGVLRTTRDEMAVDELEELEVADGILVARSDRSTVELDAGLEPAELRWIKAVVESAVTS